MEQAHHAGQAPVRRLLLVRLLLLLLGGVLLVLLSSRPAGAAERQRSGLPDPVGGTLAAATEPVGSLARGAAGTVSSTVGRTAGVARRSVASQRRPAARPAVGSTAPARAAGALRRGAPAITSPVRRTASPSRSVTHPLRHAAGSPAHRLAAPVRPALGPASGALAPAAGPLAGALAPVAGPVGGALDPVLGPLGRRVGELLPGGLLPVELPLPGGPPTPRPVPMTSRAGPVADLLTSPASAGPAPIVSSSVAGEPWAVHRVARHHPASPAPRVASRGPAPAELPTTAGRDAVSDSSATGVGLAALAGALLLFGLRRHPPVRAERSGIRSRSYLQAGRRGRWCRGDLRPAPVGARRRRRRQPGVHRRRQRPAGLHGPRAADGRRTAPAGRPARPSDRKEVTTASRRSGRQQALMVTGR